MKTTLRFARPPSVNNLFATNWSTKRRQPSKAYEKWQASAATELMIQRPFPTYVDPVRVEYRIQPPAQTADVCNYEKAISDLLVYMRVLQDDSLIHEARILWDDGVPGVLATIEPLGAAS